MITNDATAHSSSTGAPRNRMHAWTRVYWLLLKQKTARRTEMMRECMIDQGHHNDHNRPNEVLFFLLVAAAVDPLGSCVDTARVLGLKYPHLFH